MTMKKTILALIISAASASSCKKEKDTDVSKGSTTVYLQAEAIDFDNVTTTISPVSTVTVIEP